MTLRKIFHWILRSLLLLTALLILGEFAYFLKMTRSGPPLHKADLIAVFTGEYGRVEEGFRLANQGYGPCLVVSRASSRALARYERDLKTSKAFHCILEAKARTTFENAVYTRQIMLKRRMHSVILVTSWDHVPRAYLLLRILCRGSDIRIECDRVPTGRLDGADWYHSSEGWKRVYNEMVQTWGSLYEWVAYRMRGALPRRAPNQSRVVAFLRKMLLFHINRRQS